ncbi:MAG: hypothetical protein GY737_00375 [Desulfobacteraceae bacterium]|nr:hypothetical protein [Desulfobacteraceae bacterium]
MSSPVQSPSQIFTQRKPKGVIQPGPKRILPEHDIARAEFGYIPTVRRQNPNDTRISLLPKRGGRAGVIYGHIPDHLTKVAREQGWMYISEEAEYIITGPKGSIKCRLMAYGGEIPGVAPESGVRGAFVDESVYEVTGLNRFTGMPDGPEEKDAEEKELYTLEQETAEG